MSRQELESKTKEDLVELVLKLQADSNADQTNKKKRKFDQVENSPEKPNKKQKVQRAIDWSKYSKRHIALKVAYIGWNYHGLAVQQDTEETVEGHLIRALLKTHMIEDIKSANFNRSGRTDKGVSAFGQVISLHIRSKAKSGLGVVDVGANMKGAYERQLHIDNLYSPRSSEDRNRCAKRRRN
jgi:tRNA pseudouridine38/39 synthase